MGAEKSESSRLLASPARQTENALAADIAQHPVRIQILTGRLLVQIHLWSSKQCVRFNERLPAFFVILRNFIFIGFPCLLHPDPPPIIVTILAPAAFAYLNDLHFLHLRFYAVQAIQAMVRDHVEIIYTLGFISVVIKNIVHPVIQIPQVMTVPIES